MMTEADWEEREALDKRADDLLREAHDLEGQAEELRELASSLHARAPRVVYYGPMTKTQVRRMEFDDAIGPILNDRAAALARDLWRSE